MFYNPYNTDYLVYNSDDGFGIFWVNANDYPDEVKKNPQNTKQVKYYEIGNYLLEKVGRNNLVSQELINGVNIGYLYQKIQKTK